MFDFLYVGLVCLISWYSLFSQYNRPQLNFCQWCLADTILDLANIKLKSDQRPEDLYQCVMFFIEDNLLTRASGISHHGAIPEADEELSLSFENIVVYMWLQLLHPSLPSLFKQKYGTELRSRILAYVKPEISQALDSLLD